MSKPGVFEPRFLCFFALVSKMVPYETLEVSQRCFHEVEHCPGI